MDPLEHLLRKMPRPGPSPSLDQKIRALRDQHLQHEPAWPSRVPFAWLVPVALLTGSLGFLAGLGWHRLSASPTARLTGSPPILLRESRVEVRLVALSGAGPFDFCPSEGDFFGRSVTTRPQ